MERTFSPPSRKKNLRTNPHSIFPHGIREMTDETIVLILILCSKGRQRRFIGRVQQCGLESLELGLSH